MAERRRTPEEIAKSMEAARAVKAKQVLKEQRNRIKYARWALLAIGILEIIVAGVSYSVGHWSMTAVIIDGSIGALFLGLYFLSSENAHLAFTVGLGVYGVIQLILIMADSENLFNGFIVKLIIFSTLFSGLSALKRIPKSLLKKSSDDEILDHRTNTKDLE